MLIIILFHDSGYRCLKHFYQKKIYKDMRHIFPKIVSYNRFVELEKEVVIPLTPFIKKVLCGKYTSIFFIDSTPLRICKNQKTHIHKTFKGITQSGKCPMGWFSGFMLHLIYNEHGELLNFVIIPGNVDYRKHLEYKAFMEFIHGKLVGDKEYISNNLFERLFVDGIQLITKLKSNIKGALMSFSSKHFSRYGPLSNLSMANSRIWRRSNILLFLALRISMLRERLTHSWICSEVVELTYYYYK